MPGRAARLWSPMPAALIWYLVKPRRESGAAFLEGTQRGEHEDHCAHSVTACCSAAIWCRDPACLCHKRARRQGPLQEGDARERRRKSQRSGKWSGSGRARKRGDIDEHIGARQPSRRSSAATEQPASPETGGKALGFLGQNQGLEGRSASKTAAMSCFCFALALASSLRSNPA